MSVNTSIGLVGVAKQADKDTPASQPSYVHGLTGGQVFKLDRSVESANVSCGVRAGTDSYVSSIAPGLDFETYGYADVIPMYFWAAMGNIVSSANGEGAANNKHIITLGDKLPYFTFWGRMGGEYTSTTGCKVDTLELSFEGNSPLEFGVTVLGMGAKLGLDSIPGEIDPSCFDGYFVPTDGIFLIDTVGDAPASAPVKSGSVSISNSCTGDALAGKVTPGSIEEGKMVTSGEITVKPDDMELYRKMITGSEGGTEPTGLMVYGSFDLTFKHSRNANYTLNIKASRVPFTADFPEVNPEGGAAEVKFSFDDIGVAEKGGSPITVTILNDVASYNA